MSDLKIDRQTGDLALDANGDLILTEGTEAIDQHLLQRLRTGFSEWFLDTSRGVPWLQQILVKNPNPVVVDTLLKQAILETPGVEELESFTLDLDSSQRFLTLAFRAITIDGVVEFSEEVPF